MTKPYPALCKDCKYSKPDKNSSWSLRCTHPTVSGKDPWALSSATHGASDCQGEREKIWFAPCGRSGKLWEPK